MFNDDLAFGLIHAPNLTQSFADMSDEELDISIRHGLRRDGSSHLVMPSSSFRNLSDADFNNVVAFIRSQPLTEGPGFEMRPGIVARFFLLRGMFRTQADRIRNDPPFITASEYLEDGKPSGKYLAVIACGECHGTSLAGTPSFTPHLAIAKAYSEEAFARLMREGVGLGDRELGLMSEVALKRFKHLTDDEVTRLWQYLQTLASAQTET